MKSLINELKHRYVDRYIILDTPPILPFAEAITLSSYVDGIIFVVKEGYAQRNIIKDAVNLYKDSNILGVVFNSVSSENLDGHYSRYYRGYYGKKEKK
jgi:Mrp family chromosome partitioning ATPase